MFLQYIAYKTGEYPVKQRDLHKTWRIPLFHNTQQMTTFQEALASVAINSLITPIRGDGGFRTQELRKKQALIDKAIAFPGGEPQENMIFTKVWEDAEGVYSVRFGKYGKEYYRAERRNVNDMVPTIFRGNEKCDYDASFRAIFRLSENLKNDNDEDSLILLGCLFIRNAFLVDHFEVGHGIVYKIPEAALNYLKEKVGNHAGIPIEAFLMYMEAIAWQEDVKYTTLGKAITSDVGRKNNMLTYARFVACLLGRSSYAEMLNKFSMGISALPKNEIATAFPELKTKYCHYRK